MKKKEIKIKTDPGKRQIIKINDANFLILLHKIIKIPTIIKSHKKEIFFFSLFRLQQNNNTV